MALAGRFLMAFVLQNTNSQVLYKKYLAGILDGRSRKNNALYLPGRQSTVGLLSEISTGGEGLRGAGVGELMGQAAAKSARFGKDFIAGLYIKREHQLLVFQGTKAGHIFLIERQTSTHPHNSSKPLYS